MHFNQKRGFLPFEYAMTLLNKVVWVSVFPFIDDLPKHFGKPTAQKCYKSVKNPFALASYYLDINISYVS